MLRPRLPQLLAVALFSLPSVLFAQSTPPALPGTRVTFSCADPDLQKLYDATEAETQKNIVKFTTTMTIFIEGAQYPNAWNENQPMGGETYAKRNLPVALKNQLIFMLAQRPDGRRPGMVNPAPPASAS